MHFWIYAVGIVVYTAVVFWAGLKYGTKMDAEARAELNQLRQRWANTVAAAKGATK
ncbi:MAG TPA: hypothetical protein VL498_06920 [Terracidiphilus sp.]|jgi:cbb3-type cytochrome oxidase subunit 1|nr:hypothetical protein [Terracidiphilus sp.]